MNELINFSKKNSLLDVICSNFLGTLRIEIRVNIDRFERSLSGKIPADSGISGRRFATRFLKQNHRLQM